MKNKSQKQLNEEFSTDQRTLFFVGCRGNKFDLASNKFKDHKEFDKICVESSAFGSSTFEYALAYADQYSKENDPGVIVAFKLPRGKRFFELKNPDDYSSLGFNDKRSLQLASIFETCEPYFAINLNVDGRRQGPVPPEFKIAQNITKFRSSPSKKFEQKIVEILFRKDLSPRIFTSVTEQEFAKMYLEYIEFVFSEIFGKQKYQSIAQKLKETQFESKEEVYALSGIDAQKFCKKATFDANGYYISHAFFTTYPKAFDGNPLFENFKLCFKKAKLATPLESSNIEVVNSYLYLFWLVNKFLYQKKDPSITKPFEVGIENIKNRLGQKQEKDDEDGQHVYIDLIQFAFFHLLTSSKLLNGEENPFIGVYSPEFRGYAEIKHASTKTDKDGNFLDIDDAYGYEKPINVGTICDWDHTIIITKSIGEEIECVGYPIDAFLSNLFSKTTTKDKRTGKEKITQTKNGTLEKVKSSEVVELSKKFRENPHMDLSEYKGIVDAILDQTQVKHFSRDNVINLKDRSKAEAAKDYDVTLILPPGESRYDWVVFKSLNNPNRQIQYDSVTMNDGTVLTWKDILMRLGKDPDSKIEYSTLVSSSINYDTGKSNLLRNIIKFIFRRNEFEDYRDDEIQSLSKMSSNEVNFKNHQDVIQKLPISDEIKKFLTNVDGKNAVTASQLLKIDGEDGTVIQPGRAPRMKKHPPKIQKSEDTPPQEELKKVDPEREKFLQEISDEKYIWFNNGQLDSGKVAKLEELRSCTSVKQNPELFTLTVLSKLLNNYSRNLERFSELKRVLNGSLRIFAVKAKSNNWMHSDVEAKILFAKDAQDALETYKRIHSNDITFSFYTFAQQEVSLPQFINVVSKNVKSK